MHRTTRRILMALLMAFLAYVAVFTVAMVSQLADAADRVHAGAGQWAFWGLMALLLLAVAVPTVLVMRLPQRCSPRLRVMPLPRPPTSSGCASTWAATAIWRAAHWPPMPM